MTRRPNILLISLDNVRADHLSCYGYDMITTPDIDIIATKVTIFCQNYCTGVWTLLADTSMLTGLYVSEHGVYGDRPLAESIPTIRTLLKEKRITMHKY